MSYSHIVGGYTINWETEQDYLNCRLKYLEYLFSLSNLPDESDSFLEYTKMEEYNIEYILQHLPSLQQLSYLFIPPSTTEIEASDSAIIGTTIEPSTSTSTNTGFSTDLFAQVHPNHMNSNYIFNSSESGFPMPLGTIESINKKEIDKKSIKDKEDIDKDTIKSRFEILDL